VKLEFTWHSEMRLPPVKGSKILINLYLMPCCLELY
jgi:hypothetical protein